MASTVQKYFENKIVELSTSKHNIGHHRNLDREIRIRFKVNDFEIKYKNFKNLPNEPSGKNKLERDSKLVSTI